MKKRYIISLAVIGFSAVMMLIGRLFRGFADFYCDRIFHIISVPYAFLCGILPISVGEIMIIAALILIFIGIPVMLVMLIFAKEKRRKIASVSLTITLSILAFTFFTESMNCFTLYGCTRFSERFFTETEHDNEELKALYSMLIDEANSLAAEVPRDENDRFVLTIDPVEECRSAMKKASEKYPQLKGYYPKPKPIMFSYFMSQTEVMPEVICHEYAHLKGFMQEDEANFISYIATQGSDNAEVRYSGCLDALEYVHNQIYANEIASGYELTGKISEQVRKDWFRFLPDNYWEENEKKEIISTETVAAVSDAASDASMKLNGVEDGIASYNRMVNLLLDYYFPPEE